MREGVFMSESKAAKVEQVVFTPYYINQERLLDLFAILNGGYCEYEEIKNVETNEKQKKGSAKANASAGIRLFKFGGSAEGEVSKSNAQATAAEMRKVQTTASMLGAVISDLKSRRFVKDIEGSTPGAFVITPVRMKVNSIKGLLDEAKDLLQLNEKMMSLDGALSGKKGLADSISQMQKVSGVAKELFDVEEVIHEVEDYAVFGNVSDRHLYQAIRSDIIDIDLTCLAQVKRVFPEGTQLMKNTVFAKIMDDEAKRSLVEALSALSEGGLFAFDSMTKVAIEKKPVYQIEIVALYQAIPA